MIFDDRQSATLLILVAIVAWALASRSARAALRDAGKTFSSVKVWMPFLLYAVWLLALHWLAHRIGIWNRKLIGESVFWVGVSGAALLIAAVTEAGKEDGFFRKRTADVFKAGAFFAFFLNIKSLSLIGELLLQPVLMVLVVMRVMAAHKKQRGAQRLFELLLSLATIALVIYTIHSLAQGGWSKLDKEQELYKLLMPIWLTLGAFPFTFALAVVAEYGRVFSLMKATTGRDHTSLASRLGVILALRMRLLDIHSFTGRHAQAAGRAGSIREGMRAVSAFKADRAERAAREKARLDRLTAFAGVQGVDAGGRQLDQREFDETKNALRWIATCQMGWHNNHEGRYRPDILAIVGGFQRQGLPEDHGVVIEVRNDGQAWYAYRRTISGWVIGIGSRDAPPDQWHYEGSDPPTSFPSPGNGWGDAAFRETPNWQ